MFRCLRSRRGISLVYGAKSLVSNIKDNNVGAAIVDGIGIVADAAAVVLPFCAWRSGSNYKGVARG